MHARPLCMLLVVCLTAAPQAQVRLYDESDRSAFRAWFTVLADAQFYRAGPDVIDCAALIRRAYREALREHTPEWFRQTGVPGLPAYPDVQRPPQPGRAGWPLFRVGSAPARYAEFADARTIVALNTRFLGRDIRAARPGDLLYFRQAGQHMPDHLMVFVGASIFEPGPQDWIVYHTGPAAAAQPGALRSVSPIPSAGEVRKVRLVDLLRHPAARWRPLAGNSSFVGVFRLALL